MNSIFCLICKWTAARCLDDAATPSGWTARHLAGCPACRARYERERGVAARLARKPGDTALELPAFLHERILANLDTTPGPRVPAFRGVVRVCAVVCLPVVVLVVTLQFWNDPERNVPTAGTPPVDRTGRTTFAGLPQLSGQQAMLVFGANLGAPLEGELRYVMDDARMALSALSRNFLPTDLAEP